MYEFTADLWIWDARRDDSWTFVTVPADLAEEIREWSLLRPATGFGSVRVSVTIGATTWQTSVFPSADDTYALPVKRSVRRAEGIEAGDEVRVELELVDPPG